MMVTYDLASEGGGVKQHAVHLAASLRRLGDQVTVVGPASKRLDGDPLYGGDLHTFRGVVNIPGNGSDNFLGVFASPVRIRRFFDEHRFDVIHVHEPLLPALSYWSTWMTRDVPHVATFHAFAETEGRLMRWARRFGGVTLFPWFQRGIAVSPAAERYAQVAWKDDLAIIPNGVPTSIFHPPDERDPVRPPDGPVALLFVGRLGDARKGSRYMIDAYRRLLERGVAVTLDMVGELGDAEPPPDLPGLTYHGMVGFDELTTRYRRCDVFVAPSTGQESFGIVLLEAMASARPVVCSDIEGYRQVATTSGCRLAAPCDADGLALAIEDLVAAGPDARRRMGEHNRRHALSYDYDNLARRVRNEYLLAMGEAPEALPADAEPPAPADVAARPAVN
jgi:phosphatidyl-myo-inositol alpha-mannosyltransferase